VLYRVSSCLSSAPPTQWLDGVLETPTYFNSPLYVCLLQVTKGAPQVIMRLCLNQPGVAPNPALAKRVTTSVQVRCVLYCMCYPFSP
jgi:hypothetical protein